RFIATVKRPGLMVFLNNRTLVHDRGERGKTILIFSNPITGKEKRRLNLKGWLYAIAAEGRRVALVNKDDSLSIRTLPGGKQLCVVPKPWYDLGGARFSPDGRYLVTRSHNPKRGPHSLRVWDTKKGKLAVEVNSPKLGDAVAFNFSADSRILAVE